MDGLNSIFQLLQLQFHDLHKINRKMIDFMPRDDTKRSTKQQNSYISHTLDLCTKVQI